MDSPRRISTHVTPALDAVEQAIAILATKPGTPAVVMQRLHAAVGHLRQEINEFVVVETPCPPRADN